LALELGAAFGVVLVRAVCSSSPIAPEAEVKTTTLERMVDHPEPPAAIDDAATRERVKVAILNQLEKRGGSAESSERGLAALIGASRTTVRRSIHGLVLAGVIAAEATRTGTMLRLVA
jgi:hypothetical protein